MAKKYRALAAETMTPESRERAAIRTKALLAEMQLNELRRARELTQQELAEAIGITQGEISKLERRSDMYLSTLRRYVRAMGGELEIVARFPDGQVRISQA